MGRLRLCDEGVYRKPDIFIFGSSDDSVQERGDRLDIKLI